MNSLFSHFWMKMMALLVAGLVWLHVATDREYRSIRNIPVGRVITREGLVVASPPPDTLRVVIEATGKELVLLGTETPSIQINAASYGAGRQVIGLGAEQLLLVGSTTDARIIRVLSPEFIDLALDRMAHETIPVRALFDPLTDDGFMVGPNVEISPVSITAHGPAEILAGLDELLTDSIPMRGLRNEVTLTVPIQSPDSRIYRLEPDSVRVTFTILPTKRMTIDSIPVQLLHAPAEMLTRVTPSYLRLDLIGPAAENKQFNRDEIIATADAALVDSLHRAPIEVKLPSGWMIGSVSAQTATVNMVPRVKE